MPYPEEDFDTQPDDYETPAIHELVNKKKTFLQYRNSKRQSQWQ